MEWYNVYCKRDTPITTLEIWISMSFHSEKSAFVSWVGWLNC